MMKTDRPVLLAWAIAVASLVLVAVAQESPDPLPIRNDVVRALGGR